MAQTSYSTGFSAIGFAGGLADSGDNDVVSKPNAEASANLVFGRGVKDSANGCLNLSGGSDVLLGVLLHEQIDSSQLAASGAKAPKDTCSVLRKGRVLVLAEQAIALGDPVYVRHTANGGTTAPGRFRKDADTANAIQVTKARWVTSTSGADQIAVLELNLP